MQKDKIVLITAPFDQGDILKDFLDWHLDLGVDLILAIDHGSTDGSRELLTQYSQSRPVVWFPIVERDVRKYSPADELAAIARDRYHADWIIHCDADEFLCTRGSDLRATLASASTQGMTLLNLPRHTMTGPVLQPGGRATQTLTVRIDRTVAPTAEQQISWDLPAPFAFLDVGPHLAVRASALVAYGPGAHVATMAWGSSGTLEDLYILHYAMRGFESLCTKVENTAVWLEDNSHLAPGYCWHWRRWISLSREGRLRDDYELQFVTPDRTAELVRQGICVVDTTVADWVEAKGRLQETSSGKRGWLESFRNSALKPFRMLSS